MVIPFIIKLYAQNNIFKNLIYTCRQSKCNILSFKSNQFDLKHNTLLINYLLNI